jgi:hypothetical protein
MTAKTKEQFTVICDGLFLNDTKPQEWKYTFSWEPSVGFHYRNLDESGEPCGEAVKKYLKHIWLFQAMGGKNAKGHYFRLEAESGMIPAKDGQAAKPYTSVMPIAEVFSDGSARFLEAPKDGKIGVPSGDKPKGPPPPVKPKAPVTPKPAGANSALTPPSDGDIKIPKGMENFMDDVLFQEKSAAWWSLKDSFHIDGAIVSNAFHYASIFCQSMAGKDEDIEDRIIHWAEFFETSIRGSQFLRKRSKLTVLIGLAITRAQVARLMEMA